MVFMRRCTEENGRVKYINFVVVINHGKLRRRVTSFTVVCVVIETSCTMIYSNIDFCLFAEIAKDLIQEMQTVSNNNPTSWYLNIACLLD